MNPRTFRPLVALALIAIQVAAQTQSPLPPRVPAEYFFEPPSQLIPRISPDGTKVVLLTRYDVNHNELTVVDLATKQTRTLAKSADWSVLNCWWKNDDLLLIMVMDDFRVGGFASIDLKTGKLNELPELQGIREVELINQLPADPEHMLFRATRVNSTQNDVVMINLRSGKKQVVERDPDGIEQWFSNAEGEVISGWGMDADSYARFLVWRANPQAKWQRRWVTDKDFPPIVPFATAADGRRLLVRDYRKNAVASVCHYDPATNLLDDEVAPSRRVDPRGVERWGFQQEPGAIEYYGDREPPQFLNADMQRAHEWLEKKLPGTLRSYLGFSRDSSRAVLLARNSRNAGVYCLVNFQSKELAVLALVSRNLKPPQMAPGHLFQFTSADGLAVTAHVTLPVGVAKPPLIVRLGPNLARMPFNEQEFEPEDQFFANRGYATLRVDHRGSIGFGRDFSVAGDYQFATGMVDDYASATDWLKQQGLVDGNRVAVLTEFWGSMTGFALAARPGFCRALVNLDSLMNTKDIPPAALALSHRTRDEMLQAIGGRIAGEKYMAQTNPRLLVDQLTMPSWHYAPGSGSGIGVEASELRARLQKLGRTFEFEVGTSFSIMRKEKIFPWQAEAKRYEKMVAFLDRSLAAP